MLAGEQKQGSLWRIIIFFSSIRVDIVIVFEQRSLVGFFCFP